jgi:hypothetical protein
MPRREILSPAQREALLAIPVDRAGLIEHYVLSEQDISLVRQHRGDHHRLGIAVQLALLRFPGTALQGDETPPKPFRVLTPGSFILGRLMMLWSSRLRPLPQHSEENLEFCLESTKATRLGDC